MYDVYTTAGAVGGWSFGGWSLGVGVWMLEFGGWSLEVGV